MQLYMLIPARGARRVDPAPACAAPEGGSRGSPLKRAADLRSRARRGRIVGPRVNAWPTSGTPAEAGWGTFERGDDGGIRRRSTGQPRAADPWHRDWAPRF